MALSALLLRRNSSLSTGIFNSLRSSPPAQIGCSPSKDTKKDFPDSLFQFRTLTPLTYSSEFESQNQEWKKCSRKKIESSKIYWSSKAARPNLIDDPLYFGRDHNHWMIQIDFPKNLKLSQKQMLEAYIQIAAKVLGSFQEAKKRIYSFNTKNSYGTFFHIQVCREVAEKFCDLPLVCRVYPDDYIDRLESKQYYGGDYKYVNGTIIPQRGGRIRRSLDMFIISGSFPWLFLKIHQLQKKWLKFLSKLQQKLLICNGTIIRTQPLELFYENFVPEFIFLYEHLVLLFS